MNDGLQLPTKEQREVAFWRFGETDETRSAKLMELKLLVQKFPYHSVFDSSPSNLIKYLRGQQFNVVNAAKKIENFINFKIKYPQYTNNLTASEFTDLKHVLHVLNCRDKNGRVVVIFKVSKFIEVVTPELLDMSPLISARFNYFVNTQMNLPQAQLYGVQVIFTFSDVSLKQTRQFRKLTPLTQSLAFLHFIQNCSAHEIYGIHYFEEPFYARWVWSIAKQFVSKKLQRQLKLHGNNFHAIYDFIAPEDIYDIPTCVGGYYDLDSITGSSWMIHHKPKTANDEAEEEKSNRNHNSSTGRPDPHHNINQPNIQRPQNRMIAVTPLTIDTTINTQRQQAQQTQHTAGDDNRQRTDTGLRGEDYMGRVYHIDTQLEQEQIALEEMLLQAQRSQDLVIQQQQEQQQPQQQPITPTETSPTSAASRGTFFSSFVGRSSSRVVPIML